MVHRIEEAVENPRPWIRHEMIQYLMKLKQSTGRPLGILWSSPGESWCMNVQQFLPWLPVLFPFWYLGHDVSLKQLWNMSAFGLPVSILFRCPGVVQWHVILISCWKLNFSRVNIIKNLQTYIRPGHREKWDGWQMVTLNQYSVLPAYFS